ncbi:hypothetical protein F5J12DRAFT_786221 [Pisolithus orientalis]|uniref:uncharacterized protein n=1 Tax=Pisolithus orientalis TaxID=936130 RepID=UPI002224D7FD|nr:uncharacterized protein F5J12DRAFT_786221 [Pisolithus orientalis]KAI5992324.1 hypothetical protein F5J12DRAFT_786221 [Pisolithus orientalis]
MTLAWNKRSMKSKLQCHKTAQDSQGTSITRATCSAVGQDVANGVEDVEEMFGDGPTQEESLGNSTEVADEAVTARKCSANGDVAGIGKVKDWAEKPLSSKAIHSPRVSASSASHSHASSLLNVMSLGLKGSTRSTHSSATQPLPTPASVSSRVVPVLYLGEDSKLAEFRNYTQESISKGSNASTGVSGEVIDNIHTLSITPPPPSQPPIIAKTAVSVKPVKS